MFQLSEASQSELLRLSRQCLHEFLQTGRKKSEIPTSSELLEKRGAFVTLTRQGNLRGCIGIPSPVSPLYKTVQECAISAATVDSRFPPLAFSELAEIEIEISVLSPLEVIKDFEKIEIGVHGLVVSHVGRRGLLLPQVATERDWDREQFLQQTCRKAGLPLDAWKEGAKVEWFTAFVFGEGKLNIPGVT